MSASDLDSSSSNSTKRTRDHDRSSSLSYSRSSSPFNAPPELLDEYTRLLASQFGDLASTGLIPTQPHLEEGSDRDDVEEGGRPMTKAEKQNAKKKRRKERERLAREAASGRDKQAQGVSSRQSETVGFRLFSSCPVQSISIVRPEEIYPLPSNPRHQGYTDEEFSHLRKMAHESAVEWPDLGGPSFYASRWTRTQRQTRQLNIQSTDEFSNIHPNSPELMIGHVVSTSDHREQVRISNGKGKGRRLSGPPRIHLVDQDKLGSRKNTRRRRKRVIKDRPVPSYWSPATGAARGGKSMSTLWGYGLGMSIK